MNSVLQVLSHTEPLRSFFLSMEDSIAEDFRKNSAPISILPRLQRRRQTETKSVKPV